jgi:hypothetical protein
MRVVVLALVAALCACKDHSPPTPTSEQTEQLNDAESMLNNLARNEDRNEEGPEDRSSGPSNTSN